MWEVWRDISLKSVAMATNPVNKPKFPVVRLPSLFIKKNSKKIGEGRIWHGEQCDLNGDLKQTVDAMKEHSWF